MLVKRKFTVAAWAVSMTNLLFGINCPRVSGHMAARSQRFAALSASFRWLPVLSALTFAVFAAGLPKFAHAVSTLQVCNKGNATVYAVVAYDQRPLLDIMGIGKSIVEGWYKINPRGCRDIWKNQASHMVYVNVGFLQSDANGNAGAVIFSPKTGRKMGNTWFCVDPVNGFKYTAKNMSAHTGACPKGRKGFRFSFSAGLENLRQTVVIRPTKNAALIPFRGETLRGRKGGGSKRPAAAPTNVNTPICKSINHVLTDAGNAFGNFRGKPFKSNNPNRKGGSYESTYTLAEFGSCSVRWREYAGTFTCTAREAFKNAAWFHQKQAAIADRIAQCTGVQPERSTGFGGVQYVYKPTNGLNIILGQYLNKLQMTLSLQVSSAATYRKSSKVNKPKVAPANKSVRPQNKSTQPQSMPANPATRPAMRRAKKTVKTHGIKQCGRVFYYVDTEILRKNTKKGCKNRRYGAVFGYTMSRTAPDSKKPYIKELRTVCIPNGTGKPIVISRGRDIPRRKVQPKKYVWGDYVTRGKKNIPCRNYRYTPPN